MKALGKEGSLREELKKKWVDVKRKVIKLNRKERVVRKLWAKIIEEEKKKIEKMMEELKKELQENPREKEKNYAEWLKYINKEKEGGMTFEIWKKKGEKILWEEKGWVGRYKKLKERKEMIRKIVIEVARGWRDMKGDLTEEGKKRR